MPRVMGSEALDRGIVGIFKRLVTFKSVYMGYFNLSTSFTGHDPFLKGISIMQGGDGLKFEILKCSWETFRDYGRKPRILSHGKVQWNFFVRYPLSKKVMPSPDCMRVLNIDFAKYTLLDVANYLKMG